MEEIKLSLTGEEAVELEAALVDLFDHVDDTEQRKAIENLLGKLASAMTGDA